VRPGKPNKAASGFFSAIIREPLAGLEAIQPVPDDVQNTHASPVCRRFPDPRRRLTARNLPAHQSHHAGVCCSVGEQVAALRRVAGERVAARIRHVPDPFILRIVEGWPRSFTSDRARALGFKAENTFDEIIRIHIDEDLGGRFAA